MTKRAGGKALRVLATGDIHIHDHAAFSTLGDDGIPSRLKLYQTLAEDIVTAATNHRADVIVIAGDLSHAPVVRPMVLHTIKNFLTTLVENRPWDVVLIPGQHDLDTKASAYDSAHSLPGFYAQHPGLVYTASPGVFTVKGAKFYLRPWTPDRPDYSTFETADVFVGHGIVRGSTDAAGYQFVSNGCFNPSELMGRYGLSIIGDIHHRQTFDEGNRHVVVPGAPIQASWKDDADCGFYAITLLAGDAQIEFVPIRRLRKGPSPYHWFFHTSDKPLDVKTFPNGHWRKPAAKLYEESTGDAIEAPATPDGKTVLDVTLHLLGKHADGIDAKVAQEIIRRAYGQCAFGAKGIIASDQRLLSLSVRNFLSIDTLDLDVAEQMAGDWLIYGPNGSGKTSLVEAIYYLVTGDTTKGLTVSDMPNRYGPSNEFEVSGSVRIGNDTYSIRRGRSKAGPFLNFSRVKDGGSVSLDGRSIAETQAALDRLTGLSAETIRLLAYFSARNEVTFTDLKPAAKNDLLNLLSGADIVEELGAKVAEMQRTFSSKFDEETGAIRFMEQEKVRVMNQLQAYRLKASEADDGQGEALRQEAGKLDDAALLLGLRDIPEMLKQRVSEMLDGLDPTIQADYRAAGDKLAKLSASLVRLTEQASAMETAAKKAREGQERVKHAGTCPTCNQPLPSPEKLLANYASELRTAEGRMKELKAEAAKVTARISAVEKERAVLLARVQKAEKTQVTAQRYRDMSERISRHLSKLAESSPVAQIKAAEETAARLDADMAKKRTLVTAYSVGVEAASWIARRLLGRSGLLVSALNSTALDALVAEMNQVAGDEAMFHAGAVMKGGNPQVSVSFDGEDPVSHAEMSGGQKRLADIVLMVSLNNLVSRKFRLRHGVLGLVVFDEVFLFLDDRFLDVAQLALGRSISPTRLVVSHDARLQSAFSQRIRVSRTKGGSSLYEVEQ